MVGRNEKLNLVHEHVISQQPLSASRTIQLRWEMLLLRKTGWEDINLSEEIDLLLTGGDTWRVRTLGEPLDALLRVRLRPIFESAQLSQNSSK